MMDIDFSSRRRQPPSSTPMAVDPISHWPRDDPMQGLRPQGGRMQQPLMRQPQPLMGYMGLGPGQGGQGPPAPWGQRGGRRERVDVRELDSVVLVLALGHEHCESISQLGMVGA